MSSCRHYSQYGNGMDYIVLTQGKAIAVHVIGIFSHLSQNITWFIHGMSIWCVKSMLIIYINICHLIWMCMLHESYECLYVCTPDFLKELSTPPSNEWSTISRTSYIFQNELEMLKWKDIQHRKMTLHSFFYSWISFHLKNFNQFW